MEQRIISKCFQFACKLPTTKYFHLEALIFYLVFLVQSRVSLELLAFICYEFWTNALVISAQVKEFLVGFWFHHQRYEGLFLQFHLAQLNIWVTDLQALKPNQAQTKEKDLWKSLPILQAHHFETYLRPHLP